MWAYNDALYTWDRRISTKDYDTVIWQGKVNSEQFHTIGKCWIDKYFGLDEYYFIDNKPVVSTYDLQNFIDGLGGIKNTANEMIWLENEAKKSRI